MPERTFTIGRDPGCDVPIADDSVSRRHADLLFTAEDHIFVTDRGSSNGTFVIRKGRREKILQEFVSPDDILQFGDASMSVRDLLASIERKHRDVKTSQLRAAGPRPPERNAGFRGARLVRCACGEVKKQDERCRTCGA